MCIVPATIHVDPIFYGCYDVIHVDEKWFTFTQEKARVITVPGEIIPQRTCRSKKFLQKLMFFCAIARPRFDPETGECIFDGKLGIWPFVERVPAKRSSANRPRGTLELKTVNVDRDSYREMLIDNLIPAILKKIPDLVTPIKIQQDNARPHIDPDDTNFVEAAENQGLPVEMYCQSPQSPDFNVCDLGFFRSFDGIQQEQTANTLEELITNVQGAFREYCPHKLNRVWLSYQQCMIEAMKLNGGNNYKLPHMKKDRLIRQGLLPTSLNIPLDLVQRVQASIAERS